MLSKERALALLLALCLRYAVAQIPEAVIAVANRDAEGAVVLDADANKKFVPLASDCRKACVNNTKCNIWVWCGAVSGCATAGENRDPRRFQQCWLKYDTPPKSPAPGSWPRSKNMIDQPVGWMSGTTTPGMNDQAPATQRGYSCFCQGEYWRDGFKFRGVCSWGRYDLNCPVPDTCKERSDDGTQSCPPLQPCTVMLDTDLQEDKVVTSGDNLTADSAEDCNDQCAQNKGCNTWTWCSDSRGCNGELFRFRQCWLKTANPDVPNPKKGYGGSPGWISGVRPAWLAQ